jgi:hypothetical protein
VNAALLPDPDDVLLLQERSRRFQLARVLKVTEQMLHHANAGEWDEVEQLEARRKLELDECFQLQDTRPSELVAEALATLIYLNEQLVQIVRYARDRASEARKEHKRTIHAVRAYSDEEPG